MHVYFSTGLRMITYKASNLMGLLFAPRNSCWLSSSKELLSFLVQYAAFENLMYSIKLITKTLICKSDTINAAVQHHKINEAWGINEHTATTLLIPTHMICDVLFDWMTTTSLYPL